MATLRRTTVMDLNDWLDAPGDIGRDSLLPPSTRSEWDFCWRGSVFILDPIWSYPSWCPKDDYVRGIPYVSAHFLAACGFEEPELPLEKKGRIWLSTLASLTHQVGHEIQTSRPCAGRCWYCFSGFSLGMKRILYETDPLGKMKKRYESSRDYWRLAVADYFVVICCLRPRGISGILVVPFFLVATCCYLIFLRMRDFKL